MMQIRELLHSLHFPRLETGKRKHWGLVIFASAFVLYSFYISGAVHNPSLLPHYAGRLHISDSVHPMKSQGGFRDKPHSRSHRPILMEPGEQALPSEFDHAFELNGHSNDKPAYSHGIELSKSEQSLGLGSPRSREDHRRECVGKFVYIYELPAEFNEDLVDKCGRLTDDWAPLCGNLNNNGYGPHVPTKTKALNDTNIDSLANLEPPQAWYRTEQFSLELIFHERLRRGYPCLTQDPELASAFYIPYYAALDTAFTLFDPNLSTRDHLAHRLMGWLSGNAVWTKFQGVKTHFMVLGRIVWDFNRDEEAREGWGSALLSQNELRNVTKLLLERRPWISNEVAIPYPTSFHPSSLQDMELWQEKLRGRMSKRSRLLCSFIGSTSRGTEWAKALRAKLANQCHRVGGSTCQEYKCGDGNAGTLDCVRNPEHVTALFLSSTFCLQPSGDSATRKGIFDSLLAGCIPIFFSNSSAYTQYMWHLPQNGSLYSLFFDGDDVIHDRVDVFSTLVHIANDTHRLRRMQEEIIRILPQIVYFYSNNHTHDLTFHDAFDEALENFLQGSSISTS